MNKKGMDSFDCTIQFEKQKVSWQGRSLGVIKQCYFWPGPESLGEDALGFK